MFEYRVAKQADGSWSVAAAHAGDEPIAVGFLTGAGAATWLAEHLAQVEAE